MELFGVLIFTVMTYTGTTMGKMTVGCTNEESFECRVTNEAIKIVLYKYLPFSFKRPKTLIKVLKSKKMLDRYNFKQCINLSMPSKMLMEEEVWEELTLIDKIHDNETDMVYPVPKTVYDEYFNDPNDGDDQDQTGVTEDEGSDEYSVGKTLINADDEEEEERKKKDKEIADSPQTSKNESTDPSALSLSVYDYWIPITDSKRQLIFMNIEKCRRKSSSMTFNILSRQWPVIIIILLTAAVAGIIIWLVESKQNDEFSSSFFFGIFDGIWWAIVSMTSVGYGDKTPHSLVGRVFGIIWILLGITLSSIFTATLTSAITTSKVNERCEQIESYKEVATLKGSNAAELVRKEYLGTSKEYDLKDIQKMFDDLDNMKEPVKFMMLNLQIARTYSKELQKRNNIKRAKKLEQVYGEPAVLFYLMIRFRFNESSCDYKKRSDLLASSDNKTYDVDDIYGDMLLGDMTDVADFDEEITQPLSSNSPMTQTIILLVLLPLLGALVFLGGIVVFGTRQCSHELKRKDVANGIKLEESVPLITPQEIEQFKELLPRVLNLLSTFQEEPAERPPRNRKGESLAVSIY